MKRGKDDVTHEGEKLISISAGANRTFSFRPRADQPRRRRTPHQGFMVQWIAFYGNQ